MIRVQKGIDIGARDRSDAGLPHKRINRVLKLLLGHPKHIWISHLKYVKYHMPSSKAQVST